MEQDRLTAAASVAGPSITGTVSGQQIADVQSDALFSKVVIADANPAAQSLTVTVTLSAASDGAFTNLGIGAYDAILGEYLVTGTAAQVTAALDALVFAPATPKGVTRTTNFLLAVDDSISPIVEDSTTTVTVSSVVGGGRTAAIGGAPGYAASLYDAPSDAPDTVTGSNGTVYLSNATVFANGQNITFICAQNESGYAHVSDTNGNWDTFYAAGTHLGQVGVSGAQVSVFGAGVSLILDSSPGNAVSIYNTQGVADSLIYGSGTVILNDAQVVLNYGGSSIIYFNTGTTNAVGFFNMGWETVYGSNGTVDLQGSQASVVGGGDTIVLAYGATASLYNTAGAWDTVWSSSNAVILTHAQASVTGGGNTIYLSGAADNSVSLYATDDAWDMVQGASGTVILTHAQASLSGGGMHIYFNSADAASAVSLYATNGAADIITGSNGSVTLNDTQAMLAGSLNDIYLNGFQNTVEFAATFGVQTVHGFGFQDVMQFSKADFADFSALHPVQSGADTVITLNSANVVTLVGVTASTLAAARFAFV